MVELLAGDDPPTPDQEENVEWWAGVLWEYSNRAWRLCGDPALKESP